MTYVFVRHKVSDYSTWKRVFDGFAEFRKSSGETFFQILQPPDDANNLHILFQWDFGDNARRFFTSEKLKDAMQRSGVIEQPEIRFLDEAARGSL